MKILVYCNRHNNCPVTEIIGHEIVYGGFNNYVEELQKGYDVVLLYLEDLVLVNEFIDIINGYNLDTYMIVISRSYVEGNEFIEYHDIYSYIVDDESALGNLRLHLKNIEEELFTE